ncbi:DNA-binding protein [Acinetobacter beijerinckii]|uniref:DNA-binding protein n=1 Tax=Acinetobacter beijerinckii TaxID=262668 RepID=UPI0023DD993D|nr:DNA-binding protein [Acinetobacter beijerinckii]MDF2418058.1 DNA-binding protein [Acinetobacter beijerinckii]
MPEVTITLEVDSAPQLVLGQTIFGGIITALKLEKKKLVPVSYLVDKYSLSDETIRTRCISINKGTNGKHLYDPDEADAILKNSKRRRGPKRIN